MFSADHNRRRFWLPCLVLCVSVFILLVSCQFQQENCSTESLASAVEKSDHAEIARCLDLVLIAAESDDYLDELLLKAASSSDAETVKILLERGADPNGMPDGLRPPLSSAIYRRENIQEQELVVKLLIQSGANVNWDPKTDHHPLAASIFFGQGKHY